MVKVEVREGVKTCGYEIEYYNSISRIPLTINLRNISKSTLEIINYDCISEGGFIKFSFDKEKGHLVEINVVSINYKEVKQVKEIPIYFNDSSEKEIVLKQTVDCTHNRRFKHPIHILRTFNSFCIYFSLDNNLEYYKLVKNVFIGINLNGELGGMYLSELTEENIKDIIG